MATPLSDPHLAHVRAYLNPSDTPTSEARAWMNGRGVSIGQWLPNFSFRIKPTILHS